uniref:Uncharacterized protein n=1 Tax=Opuntia streptacantha TaxID=393608 RepID=A0A7C9E7P9_OPUST
MFSLFPASSVEVFLSIIFLSLVSSWLLNLNLKPSKALPLPPPAQHYFFQHSNRPNNLLVLLPHEVAPDYSLNFDSLSPHIEEFSSNFPRTEPMLYTCSSGHFLSRVIVPIGMLNPHCCNNTTSFILWI